MFVVWPIEPLASCLFVGVLPFVLPRMKSLAPDGRCATVGLQSQLRCVCRCWCGWELPGRRATLNTEAPWQRTYTSLEAVRSLQPLMWSWIFHRMDAAETNAVGNQVERVNGKQMPLNNGNYLSGEKASSDHLLDSSRQFKSGPSRFSTTAGDYGRYLSLNKTTTTAELTSPINKWDNAIDFSARHYSAMTMTTTSPPLVPGWRRFTRLQAEIGMYRNSSFNWLAHKGSTTALVLHSPLIRSRSNQQTSRTHGWSELVSSLKKKEKRH